MKARFSQLSDADKNKLVLCILCEKHLKVLKLRAQQPMADDRHLTLPIPAPPRKQPKSVRSKFPRVLVREIQHLAAFQCQIYIFTQVEKIGKDDRENHVQELFYGNPAKNIKGLCAQIVLDGDHAFKLLYATVHGEDGSERCLRVICSGGSSMTYIAGIDFTVETISRYSNGKT